MPYGSGGALSTPGSPPAIPPLFPARRSQQPTPPLVGDRTTRGFDTFRQWEYFGGMKVKTSITLSANLLHAMEQVSAPYKNRSEFLEAAAWRLLAQLKREAQNAKDLAILNRRAARLNKEAEDVLAYQVPV